ncbi:MAG: hypothetical protein R3321_12905, partial [Nitrososphaeraceae archaeon]|nr:hypothetical protein [Nitrososphaeraceae archaeon]
SPDTSISHAASAMGTTALVLMIGENVEMWAPLGIPNKIVASPDKYDLKYLQIEKVEQGFDELIKKLSL